MSLLLSHPLILFSPIPSSSSLPPPHPLLSHPLILFSPTPSSSSLPSPHPLLSHPLILFSHPLILFSPIPSPHPLLSHPLILFSPIPSSSSLPPPLPLSLVCPAGWKPGGKTVRVPLTALLLTLLFLRLSLILSSHRNILNNATTDVH